MPLNYVAYMDLLLVGTLRLPLQPILLIGTYIWYSTLQIMEVSRNKNCKLLEDLYKNFYAVMFSVAFV